MIMDESAFVISNPVHHECVASPATLLCPESGDSSVIALVSYTKNKYGLLHTSFILPPVSTWRPGQDRGLTTSPRTIKKKYQGIRR